ncbi:MAG: 30S ribosomal protein S2, partial [Gemmatimonadota bacterium]
MVRLPGLLFIVDAKKERIGVSEANKLGLPIVAICDTNSDPDLITVPIAGNDDAIRSVELITRMIADTILEARREAPARSEEDAEESTYSSDRGLEAAPAAGSEEERRKRRRPRRRRAKPEAIAARLKTGEGGSEGGDATDAGDTDGGDADGGDAESTGSADGADGADAGDAGGDDSAE